MWEIGYLEPDSCCLVPFAFRHVPYAFLALPHSGHKGIYSLTSAGLRYKENGITDVVLPGEDQ
jgi:hypothetical protein